MKIYILILIGPFIWHLYAIVQIEEQYVYVVVLPWAIKFREDFQIKKFSRQELDFDLSICMATTYML